LDVHSLIVTRWRSDLDIIFEANSRPVKKIEAEAFFGRPGA